MNSIKNLIPNQDKIKELYNKNFEKLYEEAVKNIVEVIISNINYGSKTYILLYSDENYLKKYAINEIQELFIRLKKDFEEQGYICKIKGLFSGGSMLRIEWSIE